MKRLCVFGVLLIFFSLNEVNIMAQSNESSFVSISPYKLDVGYQKTSNLIFPYAIKSVDRGTSDILVQKAKGVDNILQLKAGRKNFEETNLSLVTSDGKFYSFLLKFSEQPAHLNLSFNKQETIPAAIVTNNLNEASLQEEANLVLGKKPFLRIGKNAQQLRLILCGVYLFNDVMWFKLRLNNSSQIDFQPEYVQFFLRYKKKSKRTAVQETEICPVYTNSNQVVQGKNWVEWSIAFNPFTVPPNQCLIIQAGNGGRALELKVKSKFVLNARQLYSTKVCQRSCRLQ